MISNLLSHISVSQKRVTAPLMGALLLLGAAPAVAEVGITGCMADNFGKSLNCTANDINASNAKNLNVLDGCDFPGDTATFTIDFDMTSSGGTTRFDIGLYVAEDGGDVENGTCNIYSPPETPDPPFVNIDRDHPLPGSQACGDIDSSHNPITSNNVEFTVTCIDTDNDGDLDVNWGTTWRQLANPNDCKNFNDVYPGTKAKCFISDTPFEIDIDVPAVLLGIDKSGPTNVAPGDTFVYNIVFGNETTGTGYDQDATNFQLVDQLEPELTFISAAVSGGGGCGYVGTPGVTYGGLVICTWPPGYVMPVGGAPTTVLMTVRVDPTLPLTQDSIPNEACVTGEGAVQKPPVPVTVCDDHTVTTPVTISYFHTDGSNFDWTTATERGNAGFNLYVKTNDGREKINGQLIPTKVVDSSAPQDYHYEASGVEGDKFYIEDVGLLGSNRLHGPFRRGKTHGKRIAPEPIDWAVVNSENESLKAQRAGARKAKAEARLERIKTKGNSGSDKRKVRSDPESSTTTETSLVSATTLSATLAAADYAMADLRVSEAGVYRVTYEDLFAIVGSTLDGAPMASLALTKRGKPVQIYVSSESDFGPGEYIEFIGEGEDTLYTDTSVYKLQVNEDLAARVDVDDSKAPRKSSAPSYYMEKMVVENNNAYNPLGANGDPWYDTRMLTYSSDDWTFNLSIDNLVTDAPEEAVLAVQMWGVTDQVDGDDHRIDVAFNGTPLSEVLFDGLDVVNFSQSLSQGALFDGDNTLVLTASKPASVRFDMSILESYGVTYPRAFVARDGVLIFEGQAEKFAVEGLGRTAVVAYRMRSSGATTRTRTDVRKEVTTVRGGVAKATYYVVAEAALLKPEIVLTQDAADIVGGQVDLLIVSHPNFLDGLAPLVNARQAQGMSVKLVDVEDVYTRYSDSTLDAEAIREYLKYAVNEMGVGYVLLVGGDTTDYRQYIGESISHVPSLYAKTSEYFNFAAVDPLYVDVTGDNIPDASIGRFPVRTQEELDAMVAKTLKYGARGDKKTAVLAADDGFASDAESFAATLPADWSVEKAYIQVDGLDLARSKLLSALDAGPALSSFVGHSGYNNWTYDPLLYSGDAENMKNEEPIVVVQWGCENTNYVDPTYNTMAHKFLLSSDKSGASAVAGATAASFANHERALGDLMMSRLVTPGKTIGTAMLEAKQELGATKPKMLDVLLGWTLLGDPSVIIQPSE